MSNVPAESPDGGADQAVAARLTSRYGWLPLPLQDGARRTAFVRRGPFAVMTTASVVFVLFLYGFLPGMSQVPLTSLMGTGAIQCLRNQGIESLSTWCMSLGLPVGAPRLTGLPQIYIGWLLTYLPGVDAWDAHQISNAAFVVAAFVASYALLRRWEAPRWIAVLVTTSYLTAANVLVLNGFEYTFLGFILLPAYVYGALRTLDAIDAGRWVRALLVTVGLSLFMVFTEGYSFFGAGLVIACLVGAWALRAVRLSRWWQGLAGLAMWTAAAACAALLYAAWVPDGAFETAADLASFGAAGVDVVTLFRPANALLFPKAFGVEMPDLGLWGDSQTIEYNYLGYLSLALALGFLIMTLTRMKPDPREEGGRGRGTAELRAVAVAGAIALVLALGPVLKVGQTVPELSAGLVQLPTAWLYENVPGLSEMRAVHRWLVVTRWSLMMLAAGGLTLLWRRWRGPSLARATAVVVLAAVAVLEVAADIPTEVEVRQLSVARVVYLREGIVAEADELVREGETVLMLPSGNDFLANYLIPMVGARSYNVGVDKNYVLAVAHWPAAVLRARASDDPESADVICEVLASDADAVLLPYVSPFYGPLLHGNYPEDEAERRAVARELAEDPRFDAEIGEWLTVLRSAGASCSGP